MDISQITDYLYVGGLPRAEDAETLLALNVRLVISMAGNIQPDEALTQQSFKLLWLKTYDTIFTPIPIDLLMEGVQAALPVIQDGGCVYAHCAAGRHRGVAMGAAILIAMGHSAQEAMQLLHTRRRAADPYIWYIQRRIRLFEKQWNNRS
ncbi:MAG: dual specificity protein phosphatase family protein [Anaerolineae bacterium]|nr:dual specificity protein phosphatase family protein [Anaerolineae bacterium]